MASERGAAKLRRELDEHIRDRLVGENRARLNQVIDGLLHRATGCTIQLEKEGEPVYIDIPPDVKAATYILDRVAGPPPKDEADAGGEVRLTIDLQRDEATHEARTHYAKQSEYREFAQGRGIEGFDPDRGREGAAEPEGHGTEQAVQGPDPAEGIEWPD